MKKRKKQNILHVIQKLADRATATHKELQKRFPRVVQKFEDLKFDIKDIRRHSAQILSAAALAGGVVLLTPIVKSAFHVSEQREELTAAQWIERLTDQLKTILPTKVVPLSPEVEEELHRIFKKTYGINAVAELEGNHLNATYGYMGAEQHLPRYPGDTISQHDELQSKGQTPGKGAWGYFAESKAAMTPEDYMKEKYYVAVQTLYLPNWNTDYKTLKEWYKHRKVLVVNPSNGKSVVAVIADAGPAAWTGKQFGGSPKVMEQLALNTGRQKGAVILFFVDDQQNSIALGPIHPQQGAYLASARKE